MDSVRRDAETRRKTRFGFTSENTANDIRFAHCQVERFNDESPIALF
jgi:hypothetical protein